MPRLYETEHVPLKDKLIHLHLFLGGCDWYVAEFDLGDIFFGFAILNNDYQMAEWGYCSFSELRSIKVGGLEIDCELEEFWKIRKASEVDKIKIAHGWLKEEETTQDLSKEVECPKCSAVIIAKPDATDLYCEECEGV